MDNCNILLVSDKLDVANDFVKSIRIDRNYLDIATNEKEAVAIFDSKQPGILLFSYTTVELSQDIYFGIYRNATNIQQSQHRAIVLCDHVDIEKAQEKCMRNIFFDYVVLSPRFDRVRVNLSIRNALISIAQGDGSTKNREFARLGESVGAYSSEMQSSITKSPLMIANNEKSFNELSESLTNNIKKFSTNLINKKDSSAGRMTEAEISKEVDSFSLNVVEKDLRDSKEKINAVMQGYTARLAANQKKHEAELSELNELSASVPKRVLVVEDNEVYGDMVRTILNKAGGFEVILTSTVHQGMISLITYKPDIVLLDYELPDATAGEFLEKARAVPSTKNIPVIILTSHNNSDVYNCSIMLGAQDFLVKPASRDLILGKMNKWLPRDKKAG